MLKNRSSIRLLIWVIQIMNGRQGEDNETYPSHSNTRECLDGVTMLSTHKTS